MLLGGNKTITTKASRGMSLKPLTRLPGGGGGGRKKEHNKKTTITTTMLQAGFNTVYIAPVMAWKCSQPFQRQVSVLATSCAFVLNDKLDRTHRRFEKWKGSVRLEGWMSCSRVNAVLDVQEEKRGKKIQWNWYWFKIRKLFLQRSSVSDTPEWIQLKKELLVTMR